MGTAVYQKLPQFSWIRFVWFEFVFVGLVELVRQCHFTLVWLVCRTWFVVLGCSCALCACVFCDVLVMSWYGKACSGSFGVTGVSESLCCWSFTGLRHFGAQVFPRHCFRALTFRIVPLSAFDSLLCSLHCWSCCLMHGTCENVLLLVWY